MIRIKVNQNGQQIVVTDQHVRWFAFGWFVLGVLSLVLPAASSWAMEVILAAILVVAGGYQSFHAWRNRETSDRRWALLVGLLVMTMGVFLLSNPPTGIITLSMLLILFFLMEAVLMLRLAYIIHQSSARWWGIALNGVFNLLLVGLIAIGWPETALWLPGVLLGVSMISYAFVLWRLTASFPR